MKHDTTQNLVLRKTFIQVHRFRYCSPLPVASSLSRSAASELLTSLDSLLCPLLVRRTHRRLSSFARTGLAGGAWPTLPLSCALPLLRRRSTLEDASPSLLLSANCLGVLFLWCLGAVHRRTPRCLSSCLRTVSACSSSYVPSLSSPWTNQNQHFWIFVITRSRHSRDYLNRDKPH